MSDLWVERRNAADAFQPLRDDWNRLVDQSARPTVFLSWEWLHAWWTHFGAGNTLHLLVVRDKGDVVVGIGPFCIERTTGFLPSRVLRFLGARRVGSDYLDVLAAPGLERDVSAAILGALREGRAAWDFAELSDLLDDSVALRHLGDKARETRCAVGISAGEYCPYLPLAPTREEYFESLGRSKRSRLKRAKRATEGIGCTYRLAETRETLGPALDELFDLHTRRWAARGLPGNLGDPAVRAFHHMVARLLGHEGMVRIYTLEREGRAVASDYVLQRGKTVYFYQTAFDPDPALEPYSPGYTLLAHCLEDSIERGAREFDFLRGREEYKVRWTSEARETRTLTIVPREHGATLARFRGEQVLRWTKRKAKALLSRGNLLCAV